MMCIQSDLGKYTKTPNYFQQTTLELLRSEHPEDMKIVEAHLNRIRSSCIEEVPVL